MEALNQVRDVTLPKMRELKYQSLVSVHRVLVALCQTRPHTDWTSPLEIVLHCVHVSGLCN